MISKSMEQLVQGNSVIRALFEEGKEMAAKVGAAAKASQSAARRDAIPAKS